MGQKHKIFREFWTPFLLRVIRGNPRSMYARVSKVMAQFVLKIEKLSHIMGPTPILEMGRAYGLRPRLWLLLKYFAKANSAFIIFLHRRYDRFIVYQSKTVSLLSNRDSKVTKRIPCSSSSSSSHLLLPRPDSINAERSNLKSLPLPPLTAATQYHTKMMYHWIIHHFRTFSTE